MKMKIEKDALVHHTTLRVGVFGIGTLNDLMFSCGQLLEPPRTLGRNVGSYFRDDDNNFGGL